MGIINHLGGKKICHFPVPSSAVCVKVEKVSTLSFQTVINVKLQLQKRFVYSSVSDIKSLEQHSDILPFTRPLSSLALKFYQKHN